jgi:hypothetical protein
MHRNLAQSLLPLVHQQDFNELFQSYIDSKINDIIREFEQGESEVQMWKAQGKLHMLRKIRDMQIEVKTAADRKYP